MSHIEEQGPEGIAIVGMAGRFPGAPDVETFWRNLCAGVESIRHLLPDEDLVAQNDPELRDNPNYIPAGGFLDGIEQFDAAFFGYNAREAQIMDPQQRLFLEVAWEALERAGYDARRYPGRIGIYAGAGLNKYLLDHVYPNRDLLGGTSAFQTTISSDKDFLATRVAYKLGLKGPALTVQTACSTSLVAVALACQSLQTYQADMMLAGGVSLLALEQVGYLYEQGGIASPDGHCRAFDAQAGGTVGGSGLGVVVLKRLEDALADGDQVYAVIRSVAVNNDGDDKMGYTAPSINGQAEVITEALALAGVDPATVGYVEAHGTGTPIGDPIELAALTQAFRSQTDRSGYCAIGSVKTNIGHLDAASGVSGLIKASLTLKHGQIPPSLHFRQPNPQIDFADSPFFVNARLRHWEAGPTPRRAGVSSFGIGGTNAHAVLEEAPARPPSDPAHGPQLLTLSARSVSALERACANLAAHVADNPDLNLADVAYTLQNGRRAFNYRRTVIGDTAEELIAGLTGQAPRRVAQAVSKPSDRPLIFLFPGQGSQHVNMGRQLYEQVPTYRDCVDYCSDLLIPQLGLDLRDLLFPPAGQEQAATTQLDQTGIAQVALFVTEYALTRVLDSCGLRPSAMIGHSLGEYVAACVAGVLTLDDALRLVAERGRLMQSMQPGRMLSVSASADRVEPLLGEQVSMAVIYGPGLSVVGGPDEAIEALIGRLEEAGIEYRRLHTSHAFHSWMMDPMLEPFGDVVREVQLNAPGIPYISCTTGTWITEAEVLDPLYWARHVRQTVRLADGLQTLLAEPDCVLVEVGPVQTLKALLKQLSPEAAEAITSVPVMRHPYDIQPDTQVLLQAISKFWLLGVEVDFTGLYTGQDRRRVVLPTYPFERYRYWIDANYGTPARASGPRREDALALPDPLNGQDSELAGFASDYVAPRSETERKVATIWARHLGEARISIHDDFFELGGHSLLAIGLMAELRETFQLELSERMLYEHSSVAALSTAIDQTQDVLTRIVPIPRDRPAPASWFQERCWVRDQHQPELRENNVLSIGWELTGALDTALFERSFLEVVRRHDMLRASFDELDGQVVQIIPAEIDAHVPVVELAHLPEPERTEEMLRQAAEQDRTAFDMRNGPLWRMTLFRLEPERYGWVVTAHQAIWDGLSIGTILTEMIEVYARLVEGQPWKLAELPVQYPDMAHWERERFRGKLLDQRLAYWRGKLSGELAPVELPTDRPRPPRYARASRRVWHLDQALTNRLRALTQEHRTTMYVTLVAGFKLLCSAYSGQDNIIFEGSFPNRDRPELEWMIGPLVNMVLFRTDLGGADSFHEVLRRTRDTIVEAIANWDIPFAKVMEELLPEHYARHQRLGRIFVAQYPTSDDEPTFAGVANKGRLRFRKAMPDIYMGIFDYTDHIEFGWEYSTHLFSEETIQRMAEDYIALLEHITAQPDAPLPSIDNLMQAR